MVADQWGAADRIPKKDRRKYEIDIHDNTVRRYAIFRRNFHQLYVIEHVHKRHGQIRHHLGGAICTALQQLAGI